MKSFSCHVKRSRDIWSRSMIAPYSQPDSSTQFTLSEAERGRNDVCTGFNVILPTRQKGP
jgi:hypothetical protein